LIDACAMFYRNRIEIKIVTIHKNFFSNRDIFYKFLQDNRKEPEPKQEYIISAPTPGGNLISVPTLTPQHCLNGIFLKYFLNTASYAALRSH
jgi:hypothetical protein